MKNIFIFFIVLLFSQAAFAECNLGDIGLGKKFSNVSKKFKMDDDFIESKKYYKNIRGSDICPILEGAEVSMLFLKDTLAKIEIYKISNDSVVLNAASSSFGVPAKTPNKDDPDLKSYSTFWDSKKSVATYSFSFAADKKLFTERLAIQSKDFSKEITALSEAEEGVGNKNKKEKGND